MMHDQDIDIYHADYLPSRLFLVLVSVFFVFFICLTGFFFSAPGDFPQGSLYTIGSGETISTVSTELASEHFVRSAFVLKYLVYFFSFGQARIISGEYAFSSSQNVWDIAERISHGDFGVHSVRVTIPEGLSSFAIADILAQTLPQFNKNVFDQLVQKQNLEGYLFPDTYFLTPTMSEQQIITLMHNTFIDKVSTTSADIVTFGKSESDVIKMASILEEEARTPEDRMIVAGILWKRIKLGMALQVDSSFKYIEGKTSAELTMEDLSTSSPYNSYTNRGLPPTPISNPGLESIEDAIHPIKTNYLYFLSDKEGNMHYAVTLAQHVLNKQKYLN